ncbi:tetratricopeptide repeat protein [Dongia soli]|uniref:Tetratricopeptide repeat protein n=1 Tax=Dongia soli TaxID=600628 RepID=A0ABU5ED69_9PROT|nr:tetratricopeptide repeat protein [Dongia soli]MDY0884168.1 tetratricopeptide repeat protein [Dongia soli]
MAAYRKLRLTAAALIIGALSSNLPEPVAADGNAGFEAFERGDYATALKEFQPLADQGLPAAQAALGQMYLQGMGVAQDYAMAAKWLTPAATNGIAAAQVQLATLYMLGMGVPKDEAQAAYWTKRAADHGVRRSQVDLAAMYYQGVGLPRDLVQAYLYAELAARQGDEEAIAIRSVLQPQLPAAQIKQIEAEADIWKPSQQ